MTRSVGRRDLGRSRDSDQSIGPVALGFCSEYNGSDDAAHTGGGGGYPAQLGGNHHPCTSRYHQAKDLAAMPNHNLQCVPFVEKLANKPLRPYHLHSG